MDNISNNLNNQYISKKILVDRNNFNALALQANSKQIDKPKGKLVPNYGPVVSLVIDTVDIAKDAKNLATAVVKGKSDDHKLGRMNDLGLKIGGLGIASYLATKRVTNTTKGMEFIGFAAFIASMTLWPKLFIEFPMRLKYGFNIGQKYQDSQGRKKRFSIDNQYLPWDLWSDKKINKVADHMGIDKDLPDRREFTERKMQKVMLQGNTLWMLTAGFGTPLMTAMLCKLTEKGLENLNIKQALKLAQENLGNAGTVINQTVNNPAFDKGTADVLKKILAEYQGKELQTDFFKRVADTINPLNIITGNTDGDSMKVIGDLGAESMSEKIAKELQGLCQTGDSKKVFSAEELASTLAGKAKKMKPSGEIVDVDLAAALKDFTGGNAKKALAFLKRKGIVDANGKTLDSLLGVTTVPTKEEYARFSDIITRFYQASKKSKAKFTVFERFTNAFAGKQAESYYTQIYGNLSSSLLTELSPTMKELNSARKGVEQAEKIVRRSFAGIASNSGANSEKGSMSYFIKSFGSRLKNLNDSTNTEAIEKFNTQLSELFPGSQSGTSALRGSLEDADSKIGAALKGFIGNSKSGVENTGYRTLMAVDLERRSMLLRNSLDTISETAYKEQYGKIMQIARDVIYKGTFISPSEPKEIARNFNATPAEYQKALEFLFHGEMDKTFKNAFPKGTELESVLEKLEEARKQMFDLISSGNVNTDSKAAALGKPVAEFFYENAGKRFNNKAWLMIFGGAAAALVAITLISQMFFGKTKKEEKLYKAKGGNNAVK